MKKRLILFITALLFVGTTIMAQETETFTIKGVKFTMVKVEGGTFIMGATPEQGNDAEEDERPAHQVTLSSYWIGQTEVTQELWLALMDENPSNDSGSKLPVEGVTWDDCQEFIAKLNEATGKNFRLPSEAQWEYAARGGNLSKGYKYSGSNNLDEVAWHSGNSGETTHPVGTKKANELGIYDMIGNVWEWCNDWWSDTYYSESPQNDPEGPSYSPFKTLRGLSCWDDHSGIYRISVRYPWDKDSAYDSGFRLAL